MYSPSSGKRPRLGREEPGSFYREMTLSSGISIHGPNEDLGSFLKQWAGIKNFALVGVAQDCWFDSRTGHAPGSQVRSPVGDA